MAENKTSVSNRTYKLNDSHRSSKKEKDDVEDGLSNGSTPYGSWYTHTALSPTAHDGVFVNPIPRPIFGSIRKDPFMGNQDSEKDSYTSPQRRTMYILLITVVAVSLLVVAAIVIAVLLADTKDPPSVVQGKVTAKITNRQYSPTYNDTSSPDFLNLQRELCSGVGYTLETEYDTVGYQGCSLTGVRNGSLVVVLVFQFSGMSVSAVRTSITNMFLSSGTSGTVPVNSFIFLVSSVDIVVISILESEVGQPAVEPVNELPSTSLTTTTITISSQDVSTESSLQETPSSIMITSTASQTSSISGSLSESTADMVESTSMSIMSSSASQGNQDTTQEVSTEEFSTFPQATSSAFEDVSTSLNTILTESTDEIQPSTTRTDLMTTSLDESSSYSSISDLQSSTSTMDMESSSQTEDDDVSSSLEMADLSSQSIISSSSVDNEASSLISDTLQSSDSTVSMQLTDTPTLTPTSDASTIGETASISSMDTEITASKSSSIDMGPSSSSVVVENSSTTLADQMSTTKIEEPTTSEAMVQTSSSMQDASSTQIESSIFTTEGLSSSVAETRSIDDSEATSIIDSQSQSSLSDLESSSFTLEETTVKIESSIEADSSSSAVEMASNIVFTTTLSQILDTESSSLVTSGQDSLIESTSLMTSEQYVSMESSRVMTSGQTSSTESSMLTSIQMSTMESSSLVTSDQVSSVVSSNLESSEQVSVVESSSLVTSDQVSMVVSSNLESSEQVSVMESSSLVTSDQVSMVVSSNLESSEQVSLMESSSLVTSDQVSTVVSSNLESSEQVSLMESSSLVTSDQVSMVVSSNLESSEQVSLMESSSLVTSDQVSMVVSSNLESSEQVSVMESSSLVTSDQVSMVVSSNLESSEQVSVMESSSLATSDQVSTVASSNLESSEQVSVMESSSLVTSDQVSTIVSSNSESSEQVSVMESSSLVTSDQVSTIVSSNSESSEQVSVMESSSLVTSGQAMDTSSFTPHLSSTYELTSDSISITGSELSPTQSTIQMTATVSDLSLDLSSGGSSDSSMISGSFETTMDTSTVDLSSTIEPSSTYEIVSSSVPPPMYSLSMDDVIGVENVTTSLVCILEGNLTVNGVALLKDNTVELEGTIEQNDGNTHFQYTFSSPTCTDSGSYQCIVEGDEANLTATADVTIQVPVGQPTLKIPFEIVEGRFKDLEVSLFRCAYKEGIPAAQIKWTATSETGQVLELSSYNFKAENQTDECALEAASEFYYGFPLDYNASSVCCEVKQGNTTLSACETIYVVEADFCINKTNQIYEHPYSTRSWIECVNEVVYMNQCGVGACIDVATGSCGACGDSPEQTDPFSCVGRVNEYIPRETTYPDNCGDYFWCVNGVKYNGSCAGASFLLNDTSNGQICTNTFEDSYCAHEGVSVMESSSDQAMDTSSFTPHLSSTYELTSDSISITGSELSPTQSTIQMTATVSDLSLDLSSGGSSDSSMISGSFETTMDTSTVDLSSTIEPSSTYEIVSSSVPPPMYSLSMDDVIGVENVTTSLVCILEGNLTVNGVALLKDNTVELEGTIEQNDGNTHFQYTFSSPTCTDSGSYQCIVEGDEANLTATADVTIQVPVGQPTLKIPFEIVEGRFKDLEPSLFRCVYKEGIPAGQIKWTATSETGLVLELPSDNFKEENQTDECALEATSEFYHGFPLDYNASSVCCEVKQGNTTLSACETIYVVEADFCINKTNQIYEHPYSTRSWIECVNEVVYMNQCGVGACIDVATGGCGACGDSPEQTDPFSCVGRVNEYIPRETTYPDNCGDYYRCVNGVKYTGSCPGTSFLLNDTSNGQICTNTFDDSYCAHEGGEQGITTDSGTGETQTTVAPSKCDCGVKQYIPSESTYPDSCGTYVRCVHGVKSNQSCGTGFFVRFDIYEAQILCTGVEEEGYCSRVAAGEMEDC